MEVGRTIKYDLQMCEGKNQAEIEMKQSKVLEKYLGKGHAKNPKKSFRNPVPTK